MARDPSTGGSLKAPPKRSRRPRAGKPGDLSRRPALKTVTGRPPPGGEEPRQAPPRDRDSQAKEITKAAVRGDITPRTARREIARLYGFTPGMRDFSPGRAARSLGRQLEEVPQALVPALIHTASAAGRTLLADPKAFTQPNRFFVTERGKGTPLSREIVRPMAEDIKYLATPGPVIVRYEKGGKPVYRTPSGGETLNPDEAARDLVEKFEERPLDYLLFGRGATLSAGRLAARARPELGRPGRLELETRTGERFSTPSSANPVRRMEQESLRRLTTEATGAIERRIGRELPVVGEHARAVRLGAKQARRTQRAEIDRAVKPFQRAFRGLSAGESLAVVLRAQGVTPGEAKAFIGERLTEARNDLAQVDPSHAKVRERLEGEIEDHERMLKVLDKTDDDLYAAVSVDPKLKGAYTQAQRLSNLTGDILERVEKLVPETRETRPYLTARVVRGARWRPETMDKTYSPALDAARKGDDRERALIEADLVNRYVRPVDRDNLGWIESYDIDTDRAVVRFYNQQTKRRGQREYSLAELRPADSTRARGEFVGGPEIEGLREELGQLIYFPHQGPKLREGQVPQQGAGRVRPRTPGTTRLNRAIRLMTSRWLPDPGGWSDAFVKAAAYSHALARGAMARDIAKPLNPDGSTDPRWYYVNLDSVDIPRAARERSQLAEQMDEFMASDGDVEGFIRQRIASKDPEDVKGWVQRAIAEGREPRIAQISPADYRTIFGDFRGSTAAVRNILDKPTDFWRALTLNYRPAWVVNNFVGQTLLYAINQGHPRGFAFYAQAVLDEARSRRPDTSRREALEAEMAELETQMQPVRVGDRMETPENAPVLAERRVEIERELAAGDQPRGGYFPEDLRYGFFEAEASFTGGPRLLASTANQLVRAERRMRQKINAVNSALSDNVPRRAAWYAVADKHRRLLNRIEKTNTRLPEFLEELRKAADDPEGNPRLRRLHDDLVQEVLDELIDFGDLSTLERNVIRRAIPFYSWIKGITKATARLSLNKPLRTAFLAQVAQVLGEDWLQKTLGRAEDVLGNVVPLGKVGDTVDVLGTVGYNPFQTPSDIVGYVRGAFSENPAPLDNPALALGPHAQVAAETITGRDLFTGAELEEPLALRPAVQGLRSFPQAYLLESVLNPKEPVTGAGKPRLSVPGVTRDVFGVPVPDEVLSYLGASVRRKSVTRATEIAEENALASLSEDEQAAAKLAEREKEWQTEVGAVFRRAGIKEIPAAVIRARRNQLYVEAGQERLKEDLGVRKLTEKQHAAVKLDVLLRSSPAFEEHADTLTTMLRDASPMEIRAIDTWLEQKLGYRTLEWASERVGKIELVGRQKEYAARDR